MLTTARGREVHTLLSVLLFLVQETQLAPGLSGAKHVVMTTVDWGTAPRLGHFNP
jgi:hypothetical protein